MRLRVLLCSGSSITIGNNQNISFLPTISSTSTRMHGEFLRILFLQAHRETEAHFTATGMPSQRNQSDSFRFKRAAFYQSLKSKVALAAANAAAFWINLNVEGYGIVAAPVHTPSRAPLLLPLGSAGRLARISNPAPSESIASIKLVREVMYTCAHRSSSSDTGSTRQYSFCSTIFLFLLLAE
jgi:hypothetical protein